MFIYWVIYDILVKQDIQWEKKKKLNNNFIHQK